MGSLSTFYQAHRLSTIRNADCISVVQRGRIVEQGTHDALVQRQGAYFQLVKLQQKEEEEQEESQESSTSSSSGFDSSPEAGAQGVDEITWSFTAGPAGGRASRDKRFSLDSMHHHGAERVKRDVNSPDTLPARLLSSCFFSPSQIGSLAVPHEEKDDKIKGATSRLLKMIPEEIPKLILGTVAAGGKIVLILDKCSCFPTDGPVQHVHSELLRKPTPHPQAWVSSCPSTPCCCRRSLACSTSPESRK